MEEDDRVPLLSELANGELEPRKPKRSTLLTVCPFILGAEFCERLAFYGLATNLVTYLTTIMGRDSAQAAIEVNVFEGTCYLTPLIGAVLADSLWGRYKTIMVFSSIYCVGMVCMALTSWLPGLTPPPGEAANATQSLALIGALGIIALGTGGIKPNVSAFGADQFDESDPRDKQEKASFFNWFYLAINVGSLISATAVVYVQESISWTIGFSIPAVAMLMAVLFFVSGSRLYRHVAPTESPMLRVLKVVWAALRNRWRQRRQRRARAELMADGDVDGDVEPLRPVMRRLCGPPAVAPKNYRWLEGAITEWQSSRLTLDVAGAHHGYSYRQVEEVKLVLRLLPVFFTTVLYWTIYVQMGSVFVQQGNLMERNVRIGSWDLYVRSASMSLFNTLSIIVLIPVYNRYIEPGLERIGRRPTLLQKIGWGMVIAVLAMFAAAGVEHWRLQIYADMADADSGTYSNPSVSVPLSIMWQAPQYFLVGASEVLASIAQLEFFYDQAPDVMRSCSMALQLLSTAIGSYLGGAVIFGIQAATERISAPGWLPKDLNQGRVDLFFVTLGLIMIGNIVVYLWIATHYEYKQVEHNLGLMRAPTSDEAKLRSLRATMEPSFVHMLAQGEEARVRFATPAVGIPRHAPPVEEEVQEYARSLAFLPQSPALPAMFR